MKDYDYFYIKVMTFNEDMKLTDPDGNPHPKREKFNQLMRLIALAAEAIDKVDSGDRSEDSEEIDAVFKFLEQEKTLEELAAGL